MIQSLKDIMKMASYLLLVLAALACTKENKPETPSDKLPWDGLSDIEQFESTILKSEILALEEDCLLEGAQSNAYCTALTFSSGKTFLLGKRWSAFVSADENDYITINGQASSHKVVDYPWFTISESGNWVSQGTDTGKSAIPAANKAQTEAVVRFVREDRRGCTIHFSDGTTRRMERELNYEMYVSKEADVMYVYIGEEGDKDFVCYPFKKRFRQYKAGAYPSYLDNWGVMGVKLCEKDGDTFSKGTRLFLDGEAELALQVDDGRGNGAKTYVGGTLHGFENIILEGGVRQIGICVDGTTVGEGESLELRKAKKIVMTQKSELCQAYTDSDPFAVASRIWTFENGRLSIEIEVEFLRDTQLYQSMFGMLCVLRRWDADTSAPYLTRWAVKDNQPLSTIEVADGWGSMSKDDHTSSITEYGEKDLSFALVVDEGTRKGGGMMVGTNGNAYNKIYFDLTGSYSAKKDEKLAARVHWEIEKTSEFCSTLY